MSATVPASVLASALRTVASALVGIAAGIEQQATPDTRTYYTSTTYPYGGPKAFRSHRRRGLFAAALVGREYRADKAEVDAVWQGKRLRATPTSARSRVGSLREGLIEAGIHLRPAEVSKRAGG